MSFSRALLRSAGLAVVSTALASLLVLLVGAVRFALRVRLGWADVRTGFEPNAVMRSAGLPVATAVFLLVFAGSLWALQRK